MTDTNQLGSINQPAGKGHMSTCLNAEISPAGSLHSHEAGTTINPSDQLISKHWRKDVSTITPILEPQEIEAQRNESLAERETRVGHSSLT